MPKYVPMKKSVKKAPIKDAKTIIAAKKTVQKKIQDNLIKAIAIMHPGFEHISELELDEILGIKPDNAVKGSSVVEFSAKDRTDLAKLCYLSQSISRVMLLLAKFEITSSNPNDILKSVRTNIENADFSDFLKDRTFKVNCEHLNELPVSSMDVAEEAGAAVVDKTSAKVKMNEPDIIVFVYFAGKSCYIGIDFSGYDLSKRDYKIYSLASSMNGAVAYSLLRSSGYKKGMTLLDPFSGSAIIAIEAALFQLGKSPNFFRRDKLAFFKFMSFDFSAFDKKEAPEKESSIVGSDYLLSCIKAGRSNAKVAGVDKIIHLTKVEAEWLDTKFEEKQFDIIATQPPIDSKLVDPRQIEKIYKDFFNHAEYILKDKGRIAVILPKAELFKRSIYNFEIEEEFMVWQGKQEMTVIVLKKKK
jgi:23S rRNA G2445 N2-methylase RlmL